MFLKSQRYIKRREKESGKGQKGNLGNRKAAKIEKESEKDGAGERKGGKEKTEKIESGENTDDDRETLAVFFQGSIISANTMTEKKS